MLGDGVSNLQFKCVKCQRMLDIYCVILNKIALDIEFCVV